MTGRRFAYLAAATMVAGLLAVPATAAPTGDADVVAVSGWVISRTSAAPRRLTATVTMTASNDHGVVVVFGLTGTGKSRRPAYGGFDVELGLTPAPAAYHDRTAPGCAAVCSSPIPQSDTRTLDTEDAVRATFYIAAHQATVRISDLAPGWRVRSTTLTMRVVRGEHAQATGARAARTSIERFTEATVPAGGQGSTIGVALPCAYGSIRGRGSARLTGAGHTYALDCTSGPAILGADTPGPATWRLAGDATGATPYVYRIVVVDYPRG